jgi:hypothetical protein
MRLFLHSISAALVAVLFSPSAVRAAPADALPCAPAVAAARQFAEVRALSPDSHRGRAVTVEVDLAASADFSYAADGTLHYGMAWNDVAEGWSWQPQTRPDEADYYRWKFLPLQSETEEGAAYVQEEMVGVPQLTRVERRHDYFLAFDNPHAFYARGTAGFSQPLPVADGGRPEALRLVALARLGEPATAESTTFWKAVHARPVDFTLKKYYLIGTLEALVVCDARRNEELARIVPAAPAQR